MFLMGFFFRVDNIFLTPSYLNESLWYLGLRSNHFVSEIEDKHDTLSKNDVHSLNRVYPFHENKVIN